MKYWLLSLLLLLTTVSCLAQNSPLSNLVYPEIREEFRNLVEARDENVIDLILTHCYNTKFPCCVGSSYKELREAFPYANENSVHFMVEVCERLTEIENYYQWSEFLAKFWQHNPNYLNLRFLKSKCRSNVNENWIIRSVLIGSIFILMADNPEITIPDEVLNFFQIARE
ncbi:MAG: hypothetical protein ABIE68_04550 [bacterium]